MMLDPKLTEILIMVFLSNVAGIIFKIVWDWLKGKKMDENPKVTCLHHRQLVKDQRQSDECIRELMNKTTRVETLLVAHTEQIKKELTDGSEKFNKLQEQILHMRETIAGEISRFCTEIGQLQKHMEGK